jgi:peroxin-14
MPIHHRRDIRHILDTGSRRLPSTPAPIGYNPPENESQLLTAYSRLPRRDWRDWFIMATVMGGVTFGLYATFKARTLIPLRPRAH